MIKKLFLSFITAMMIFTLLGCNLSETNEQSHAEYWNKLTNNQKQGLVASEMEQIKARGFTIIVHEYYLIDRLEYYYNDDPPGDLPLKDALKKIGISNGVIQTDLQK